jgi:hypothetical protein
VSGIILNPGSGPVSGEPTAANAAANMQIFVADATSEHGYPVTFAKTPTGDDGEGRWTFTVTSADGTMHEVDMPGLPLAQVRYMREPGQNIWDFPRLYVDGSSWVWVYALACVGNADEED